MYMPAPRRRPQSRQKPLRWRKTRISDWRDEEGLTQQQVADRLAERGFDLDRVSVGRIEGGKQMPRVEVLEALAEILKTDINSLLNYTPAQAKTLREFQALDSREQEIILRMSRAAREA